MNITPHFQSRAFSFVVLYGALIGSAAFAAPAKLAADGQPPNVVMIVSDDHAYTDYGFMGHAPVRTPNIDRLAAQSAVFRNAYVTSSLCRPSLATILTGMYPHQHRITSNDPPLTPGVPPRQVGRDPTFLALREQIIDNIDRVPTLPRLLQSRQYVSFQTGKWWEGNFRRGGFTDGMSLGERHGDKGLAIGRETMQPMYDFIQGARKEQKPFFLWYAPMMPHTPHTPPKRLLDHYVGQTPSLEIAKYWAMIEWFDETCGELLAYLDKNGLTQNTLVVYLADNGWIQSPNRPNYAPRSKQSQYNGGLRTPFILRWPGHIAPGDRNELASSIDLAPTILQAAGLSPTPAMSGLNLLDERTLAARSAIFGEIFLHNAVDINKPATSLRDRWCIDGSKKLILPDAVNEPSAKIELYDLSSDPGEERNLALSEPKTVEALHALIDRWWSADGRKVGGP